MSRELPPEDRPDRPTEPEPTPSILPTPPRLLAGAGLGAAGYALERACRVPDDDSDGTGGDARQTP